jgi:hypothetical protein
MGKVSEKPKVESVSLTVPLTKGAHDNLIRIQAERQIKRGRRVSLKELANEFIENAKA